MVSQGVPARHNRGMALRSSDLNRALLARQGLLARTPMSVTEAVGRAVALQAQEPASPYLALWTRVAGFDPAELDAAFETGQVVKATVMRITLHAVLAQDYPPMHAAMASSLRASRLWDRRFGEAGVGADEMDALLPHVLTHAAEPRTKPELEELLATRGAAHPRVWWAMRTYAPLHHVPGSGPWSFGVDRAFRSAPETWDPDREADAVVNLARRFLAGFGPASALDLSQFTMLKRQVSRDALSALEPELVHLEGPDGTDLVDLVDAPRPDGEVPAPARFLPMWDSILLAHADRSRIIPDRYRGRILRRNGDCLATVLVDGRVAGIWRAIDDGIEVTAFEPLAEVSWTALEAEARDLRSFLADRDPAVYRRYRHWWDHEGGAEVRVLGA